MTMSDPNVEPPKAPAWWGATHDLRWESLRNVLRDKHETRRAAGPPRGPTPQLPIPREPGWDFHEPAYRYGVGASLQHQEQSSWTDDYAQGLRSEWERLSSHHPWDDVQDSVQRAWEHQRMP